MTELEIRGLSISMATIVREFFDEASVKLRADFEAYVEKRISALEMPSAGKDGIDGRPGSDGKDGERGPQGAPGKDAEPVDIEAVCERVLSQIPTPKDGKDGERGLNGKDGEPGKDGAAGINGRDGAPGRDGIDGKDGEPGSPGADGRSIEMAEVESFAADVIERNYSRWALEFERRAQEHFQHVIDRMPKPQDGRDGFQLEDLSVSDDGHGNITFTFRREGFEKAFSVRVPCFEYMGVHKEGEAYLRGHGVSFGGSLWIALTDNPEGKPAESSKDWQLAVKRGRDGNDLREVDPTKTNGRGPVRLK